MNSLQVLLAVRVAVIGITSTARQVRCCYRCGARTRACACDSASHIARTRTRATASALSCARNSSGAAAGAVGRGLASSCALSASIERHCGAFWLHELPKCVPPSSFVVASI